MTIRLTLTSFLALVFSAVSVSQTLPAEQSFTYAMDAVSLALDRLDPGEGRLPMLEGFVSADPAQLSRYTLPYYQLQRDVRAGADGATIVRLSARITALYRDPGEHRSEYRTLASNGRLEADVLARLSHELAEYSKRSQIDRRVLEARIDDIRSRRAAAEQERDSVANQVRTLEQLKALSSLLRMVAVTRAGATVLVSPAQSVAIVLRAQSHDEFEVVEEKDGWVRVRLGGDRTGWIRRDHVAKAGTKAGFSMPRLKFQVVRESLTKFAGNWAELRGKSTLFLWVRTEPDATADRWAYAERMFEERAPTVGPAEGIVVIFLGEPGVAAARVRDIRRWTRGTLSDAAFRARCSLDPPRAFSSPNQSQPQSKF